jgi:gliding motility-associated-like protein
VNPNNTVTPSSGPQTVCINTILTTITHNTTGATGIGTATGLPAGVTASWSTNIITIIGAPTAIGTFNYSIPLLGGCSTINATGTIIVNPDNTVSSASSAQTLCINTILPSITHTTTGATGIGTPTGLPTGVTASWLANTITISGAPTVSGIFNYSIPLTGGCNTLFATGSIIVNPNNTVTPTTGPQTLCINSPLTPITHTTTGATGIGTATGLPTGVTASWLANTITISGTPATSGTFNYNIPLTGGCGGAATGTITVIPSNTVTTATTPTLCINTVLPSFVHTTTGATGIGTATGLPVGVIASWSSNSITLSGTPTVSGIFNYSIPLTGGCSTINATGSIIVNPDNTVTSTTSNQTVCINTVLPSITHTTTGATGIGAATSLPPGVTATWAGNIITISGTPTAAGIFNYSIPLTGGCNTVFATGTITVNPNNTVTPSSGPQTVCINTILTTITHNTTGATGIGSVTGLPIGVTASWSANTITISGAPTAIGTFNYSITLTGGCNTINATGTIIVNPDNTVSSASSSEILCINTILPSITHTTTGATGIGTATGLPTGVNASWLANTITISGAPTVSGIFNYSIPLTGGCNTLFATGSIIVNPNNTVTPSSGPQTLCINTTLATITHTTTGATGIGTATGLPTGVTASWLANTITISGTPATSGTFNYNIPLTGGCGGAATGTITVIPSNTVTTATTPTLCINTVLPSFVHTTTGATGIGTATGLPVGVIASWSSNSITLSGTPTVSGIFNYSIPLTGGCSTINATGSIIVNPDNTVTSTTSNQTVCINTVLPSITHTTTGATGIGAATSLPPGVTATWAGNIITISGTPTAAGIFNYSIPLTGGCNTVFATGTITVNPVPVVNITNPAPACLPATVDITATTAGSTPGLSFTYWNNSAATIALVNPSTVSISGTYYIKGTNSFGCSTISPVVVNINPSPTATITGQNSFIVCQNGTQPQITFTASNGTAPYTFTYQVISNSSAGPIQTVTTLGASASSTISFPTTVSGNHTITLLSVQDSSVALCNSTNITLPNTAFVTVQQVGTIIPINQAVVSQTVCQNTPITPIIFTIGGAATNAFATNLPNGLSGSYASGIFTISGTPLATGVFNYVLNTSGSTNGCNSTYTGTITVNSNDSISILPPAMVNQTVCNNVAIQPIVYNLGGGATGGTVTFSPSQPLGITWSIVSNVITISGASNTIGSFNYTVQSFGICGQSNATGNITINPSTTISLDSGNPNTTVCIGSSIASPIQYSITPTSATMVVTGLPTGVTFNAGTGIITGTPTQSGTFPYSITSTTTCGNTLTGTITVNPLQSIGYLSGNTNQVACQNTAIDPINFLVSSGVNTVTITPTLPTGINYIIAPNGILTISGTPTSPTSLAQNYTITTQGTCGPQATYSITFDIRPEATITLTAGSGSINQSVCQSSAIIPITFTIGGGATGVIFPNPMPDGVTWSFNAGTGVYTIQGNPLVNGIFNFPITTTGCPKTIFVTISNVNTAVGIVLTSPTGTDNQTLCQSTFSSPIQPIIYNVIGATNIVANGLPPGVTAVFSATTGQLIISGTPLVSGVYNYTVTSQPCSIVKAGVIRVSTPISITNEVVTNVSCSNENDGEISVDIVGGLPYINPANGQTLYAIRWTGPNGFQQNIENITGLAAGTYLLSGTDLIGCPIPSRSYTVLDAVPIIISLQSSTNIDCNGVLGCANFNITGGSGIYTDFTLQYLDPSLETLVTLPPPANNNYFNICDLRAGIYYLTVEDSNDCSTIPYLFTIYDYSALSIENITMDEDLCQDNPGKIRIKVNSLDPSLTFYYNDVLVPFVDLGDNIYELSINTPTTPFGIVKVRNSQNCWREIQVSTAIITPNFEITSNDFRNYGYYSVNESIQFTQLFNMSSIPAEYHYIVWDFGDNTPFKVFDNVEDLRLIDIENVFHTYTTNGIYEITLTVYNRFGCSRKISKTIVIGSGATIMLPTIFTPNNDGINDHFRPSLLGIKDIAMQIYDNWGNLVYEIESEVALLVTDPDWGWNGIEKGQNEPINNNYRYYIMATAINDVKIQKEGRFLLVK